VSTQKATIVQLHALECAARAEQVGGGTIQQIKPRKLIVGLYLHIFVEGSQGFQEKSAGSDKDCINIDSYCTDFTGSHI
jgi:hypothetical protein